MIPIDAVLVPTDRRTLKPANVEKLMQSIARVGLINPITVTDHGELIAGLHRLEACRKLGWTEIPSQTFAAIDAAIVEIDENVVREELTELERGEAMARRKALYEARHPDAPTGPGRPANNADTVSAFTADTAAKTGVTERTVRRDVQVGSMPEPVRDAIRATPVADRKRDLIELARIPEVEQSVVAGVIAAGAPTVQEARECVRFAWEERERIERIDRNGGVDPLHERMPDRIVGSPEEVAALRSDPRLRQMIPADDVQAVLARAKEIREQRAVANRAMTEAIKQNRPAPPVGLYRCIVIDPPWPLTVIERDNRPAQAGLTYPTMTEEELMAFRVPAADECHMYLWTTHKLLPLALRLCEQWGFKYQCLMTWSKNVGFTPFSWMYSTEHALFCTRGGLRVEEMGLRLDFRADRREHSRKPDEFYDLVRRASPGPRIDMFSRESRDGFETWGAEAGKLDGAA